ncbi:hypothetical protein [Nitrosomonas sp. Nm33]|uniref:hypothetical protein n=1 Tax=Nitrosomonas sp. Nm33 TaxID=133724 RepID=UPI00089D0998|nr:hypothetical protein [Nitrosomonas sp. Nm33]SDY46523.1 hypothetical protein SAMN05421755_10245 [Nitrosomonas sp. Nm33]
MKSKVISTGVKFCCAMLVSFAVAAGAEAACTNKTLRGDYGSTCLGTVNNGAVNVALVGKFSFDGNGTGSAVDTASIAGNIFRDRNITLTYNIESSCRGTATLTIVNPSGFNPTNFDLVLTDKDGITGGRIATEVQAIEIDSGSLVTCALTRIEQ